MTRRETIAALVTRAREASKPAWWLDGPRAVPIRDQQSVPATAVYVCVAGDTMWTTLPKE